MVSLGAQRAAHASSTPARGARHGAHQGAPPARLAPFALQANTSPSRATLRTTRYASPARPASSRLPATRPAGPQRAVSALRLMITTRAALSLASRAVLAACRGCLGIQRPCCALCHRHRHRLQIHRRSHRRRQGQMLLPRRPHLPVWWVAPTPPQATRRATTAPLAPVQRASTSPRRAQ